MITVGVCVLLEAEECAHCSVRARVAKTYCAVAFWVWPYVRMKKTESTTGCVGKKHGMSDLGSTLAG